MEISFDFFHQESENNSRKLRCCSNMDEMGRNVWLAATARINVVHFS